VPYFTLVKTTIVAMEISDVAACLLAVTNVTCCCCQCFIFYIFTTKSTVFSFCVYVQCWTDLL